MKLISFFVTALPLAIANLPSQNIFPPSPADTTISVPLVIPIPESLNTATGDVTITVSSNATLSITTKLHALNSLTTLSGTFDFSSVKTIGAPFSPEQSHDRDHETRLNDIATDIPITIPLNGGGSTKGKVTVTTRSRGALQVCANVAIGNGTVGYSAGVTLTPLSSASTSTALTKLNILHANRIVADQCSSDAQCTEQRGYPCSCQAAVIGGDKECFCITLSTDDGTTVIGVGGISASTDLKSVFD